MKKPHEVLKQAVTRCGEKSVAADMGLSQSLIYKWCQPSQDPDCSGANNPLDHLMEICRLTGDENLIDWRYRYRQGGARKSGEIVQLGNKV